MKRNEKGSGGNGSEMEMQTTLFGCVFGRGMFLHLRLSE